jgi:uncharacterized protein (TIGR00255 family)
MTGFARVRKSIPLPTGKGSAGEIVLSIKSVNHRGLDLHFHAPPEMDPYENGMRTALKKKVARGHLQIHISHAPAVEAAGSALNKALLAAYIAAHREAASEFDLKGHPDLNAALRIPGMIRAEAAQELGEEVEKTLLDAMDEALGVLNRFREREGAAIAAEMRERCATIIAHTAQMEEIRASATQEFQKRLKERLRSLLRGAGIEPQRLVQEAALLADRSDIAEELMRLKTHAGQLNALVDSEGEVGKKLDFLLQEMNRETNTILSKTSGLGDLGLKITDLALAAKAEIDKIREQSLNLE